MLGNLYPDILMDRVRRLTEGLTGDEQMCFSSGRGVYRLNRHSDPARGEITGEKQRIYVGLMDLVNR